MTKGCSKMAITFSMSIVIEVKFSGTSLACLARLHHGEGEAGGQVWRMVEVAVAGTHGHQPAVRTRRGRGGGAEAARGQQEVSLHPW